MCYKRIIPLPKAGGGQQIRSHPHPMDASVNEWTLPRAKKMSPGHFFALPNGKAALFESHPSYKIIPLLKQGDYFMGWVMGLEPTTPGTTIRCSAN